MTAHPVFTRQLQPLSVDDAARSILNGLARNQKQPLEKLRLALFQICGPALARNAQFIEIKDNFAVLAVRVDWRDAVFKERIALSQRVRALCPFLRGVRIVDLPARPAPIEQPVVKPEPRDHAETEGIAHEGLRKSLNALLDLRDRRNAPQA